MALNLENEGNLTATVIKDGKEANQKLYVTDNAKATRNGSVLFECKENETLQLTPNNKNNRTCSYICGQSGSGKSFFTTNYVKQYKK